MGAYNVCRYYKQVGAHEYAPCASSGKEMLRLISMHKRMWGEVHAWCKTCGAVVDVGEAGICPWCNRSAQRGVK